MAAKSQLVTGLITAINLVFPLPIWFNLQAFTLGPIYAGSLRSRKLSPLWPEKDEDGEEVAVLDKHEAMKFPVVASITLVSLYTCIKVFGKEIISLIITTYLVLIGAYSVKYYICQGLKAYGIGSTEKIFSKEVKIWYLMKNAEKVEMTWRDLIGYLGVSPVLVAYFFTQFWVLNNLFGFALAVNALENLPVRNFKVLFGLLAALLCYDVFFVFGTDVMLTVAKSIDGPIKLLFPKPSGGFSMIGLGDIIMPGILVAMCLRYDLYRKLKLDKKGDVYFYSSLIGYTFGIVLTIFAMVFMEKEQPALLYLVPTTVLSVILTALFNGELAQLWLYSEEVNEDS